MSFPPKSKSRPTEAEGNVIPVHTHKQLFPLPACGPDGAPPGLTSSDTTITAFGGQTVQHYGTCELCLSFHVVNTNGPTILGLPTCRDTKLVTLNCSLTTTSADAKKDLLCQYKDCFEGIGCFKGEFHITLVPTVPPVIHPPLPPNEYPRYCVNHSQRNCKHWSSKAS